MTTVSYPHISLNEDGVPIITGTTTKVVEVVIDRLAYHWDADEIRRQHPHLSLAQIHSALAYYYDHQTELDEDINRRLQAVEEIESADGDSTVQARLRALGRTP